MNIGTAYIVQKIGDTEKYRCKEMHKITDITVKKWSSLFLSEVMLIENDIKTGHISVRVSRKCYQSCMKKAQSSQVYFTRK
jgi:hypothetical protein